MTDAVNSNQEKETEREVDRKKEGNRVRERQREKKDRNKDNRGGEENRGEGDRKRERSGRKKERGERAATIEKHLNTCPDTLPLTFPYIVNGSRHMQVFLPGNLSTLFRDK